MKQFEIQAEAGLNSMEAPASKQAKDCQSLPPAASQSIPPKHAGHISSALLVLLDHQARILSANQAVYHLTGASPKDLQSRLFWDLLDSQVERASRQANFRLLLNGQIPELHEEGWLACGESHVQTTWSFTLFPGEGRGQPRVVGSGIDLTKLVQVESALQVEIKLRHEAQLALRQSERNVLSLLENAQDFAVYRVAVDPSHPYGGKVTMVSPSLHSIFGSSDPSRFETWFENIHPADLPKVIEGNRRSWEEGVPYNQIVRVYHPKKGEWIWVHTRSSPVLDENGHISHFNGFILDVTEQKRAEEIQIGQRQFLELLAKGGDLTGILHKLIRVIEEQSPGMLGLILLLDKDGQHLHVGASDRLPEEYLQSIEGMQIGQLAGSCGTASYERKRVVVEDIATDPRWEGLRDLALRFELRSCWSEPVFSPNGELLGTFAMYSPQPHTPSWREIETIETAAHTVGVAIVHARDRAAVQQAYQTLEQRVADRTREVERRRQAAEGLRDILKVINSSRSLKEILENIVIQARRLTAADAGVIYRFDLEQNLSTAEAASGMPAEFEKLGPFPIIWRPPQLEILEGKPSVIPDFHLQLEQLLKKEMLLDPLLREWACLHYQHFQSYLSVPLNLGKDVYGALTLIFRQPRSFQDEEISLAVSLGDQAALAIENARLSAQTEQLAVAAERSRLARDLHDAVTQTLFSASLIAEVIPTLWERSPDEGKRRLEELRQLTRGALAEMRTLLLELRPAALLEAEPRDLFRHLMDAFISRSRLPLEFVQEGEWEHCQLPSETKLALYRITQEALNNIAKHANASHVAVRLACAPDRIGLTIRDDGCGFNLDQPARQHLGLGIMQERADSIGAQLSVQAHPGHGTLISVEWQPGQIHPAAQNLQQP